MSNFENKTHIVTFPENKNIKGCKRCSLVRNTYKNKYRDDIIQILQKFGISPNFHLEFTSPKYEEELFCLICKRKNGIEFNNDEYDIMKAIKKGINESYNNCKILELMEKLKNNTINTNEISLLDFLTRLTVTNRTSFEEVYKKQLLFCKNICQQCLLKRNEVRQDYINNIISRLKSNQELKYISYYSDFANNVYCCDLCI